MRHTTIFYLISMVAVIKETDIYQNEIVEYTFFKTTFTLKRYLYLKLYLFTNTTLCSQQSPSQLSIIPELKSTPDILMKKENRLTMHFMLIFMHPSKSLLILDVVNNWSSLNQL